MQAIMEIIRKTVVLVLIMELVMQLQQGKNYEPYLKMLVGMMMTYSLVTGIFSVFGNIGNGWTGEMPIFEWVGNLELEQYGESDEQSFAEQGSENIQVDDIHIQIPEIHIDNIAVERIGDGS